MLPSAPIQTTSLGPRDRKDLGASVPRRRYGEPTTSQGGGPVPEHTSRAPRRVTLADVAKRAGVSPALVSIVMREAPGASAESRQRILAVARDLGYRPDARARS